MRTQHTEDNMNTILICIMFLDVYIELNHWLENNISNEWVY